MKAKPSQLLSRSFWCGVAFHAGATLFSQDWIGKEEYIRLANKEWWDTHWGIWLVLMLVAYGIHRFTVSGVD